MEIVLSVGFLMMKQQKVRQGGPKPCHCSNQRGGIFKCRAQLGSCWDGLRLSFLNFKRIYVEGDPTEIVINWAKLFAWPCVSKHTAMKTNFGTSGPCLQLKTLPELPRNRSKSVPGLDPRHLEFEPLIRKCPFERKPQQCNNTDIRCSSQHSPCI